MPPRGYEALLFKVTFQRPPIVACEMGGEMGAGPQQRSQEGAKRNYNKNLADEGGRQIYTTPWAYKQIARMFE